ncbi:MAG: hypothetical protein AABW93_00030 [Nanoarchaeota archaeon]
MAGKTRAVTGRAQKTSALKNKISISWRSFIVFLVLFLVSFLLYLLSSTPLFENLFQLLSIIFGFLSLALLIVVLVFLILKSGRR